uniref:Fanconi anemia group D2 protein n=1 Tax=Globodera pallida TaxID=36090 RepID=A0A183BVU3_GLOPA
MRDTKPNKPLTKSKEMLSGREIIEDFVLLRPGSMDKYQQLCSALNTYELWSEESRTSFLSQFMDSFDILDVNCSELVHKLCKIRWHTVPSKMLPDFVNLLSALAITHVHHISLVFTAFVDHFSPVVDSNGHTNSDASQSTAVGEQFQESLYALAHHSIRNVVSCNPLSNRVLLKCFVKRFPHIKQPTPKLLAFIRNLLHFADWIDDEEIASEIWSLIVEKLLQIEALSSEFQDEQRLSFSSHLADHSKPKFGKKTTDTEGDSMGEKLDALVALVLTFLGDGDSSKLAVIGDEVRTSFLRLMRRFSRRRLSSTAESKDGSETENVESLPVDEGYEEELMATGL